MAELDVFEDFDLEALLQDFDGVPSLDLDDIHLFDLPSPSPEQPSLSPAESGSDVDSTSSWADELEKFLLESDDGGVEEPEVEEKFENNFFSDVLGSDGGKSEDGEKKGGVSRLGEGNSEGIEKKNGSSIVVDEDDDDSISKKRRRQMRNRDSALKSRERKKFYIKDLEMKSKYLESECRRLEYAFQCCVAENVALRQCLQNGRAFGAPVARQESAVLFVESLLLGSLFWLVSFICLFLAPSLPSPDQNGASKLESEPVQEVLKVKNKGTLSDFGSSWIIIRRCRGMRSRMKSSCYYSLISSCYYPYVVSSITPVLF
ncbi:hypothetical protein J5N97_006475 [Dioscorea zingiberensis]|uniref:BZIP domain-containing protein n=1 Tax=Dioscorea zingiberensis TaxID=325984 RepID=A0A9D5DBH4_9LILI|nr:hypothetical protein J5N97_006475 [Dioscorea zingiberensis]